VEYNGDGTDIINSKPAIVVYAISIFGKTPFIARDELEATHLVCHVRDMGCREYVLDIKVPINFSGWYFPKPLKPLESSHN
jgi:hypothetical protein